MYSKQQWDQCESKANNFTINGSKQIISIKQLPKLAKLITVLWAQIELKPKKKKTLIIRTEKKTNSASVRVKTSLRVSRVRNRLRRNNHRSSLSASSKRRNIGRINLITGKIRRRKWKASETRRRSSYSRVKFRRIGGTGSISRRRCRRWRGRHS